MPKFFTLEEATKLLPHLQLLLPQIQEKKRELERQQEELAALVKRATGNGHVLEEQAASLRDTVNSLVEEINNLITQSTNLGCEVKDIDLGLIDFPSWRDQRVVYLCWKLGEEEIAYWHELDAGFASRQPL